MIATIGKIRCGTDQPLVWIAGPCVVESPRVTLQIAQRLADIAKELHIPLIFKASYDKANRTSHESSRGPGLREGLNILAQVRRKTGLPVTTDVHECCDVNPVAKVCDLLQVPAFLCRQTNLLWTAAKSGRPVNIKKGQFLAPWDMRHAVAKVTAVGGQVLATERGSSFGYNRLVVDMTGIPIMREFCPVIFDATHSVQAPGGLGKASGGYREMVPYLARAAVACGCDGVFVETHPTPDEAPSDGPNMIELAKFSALVEDCLAIRAALINRDVAAATSAHE